LVSQSNEPELPTSYGKNAMIVNLYNELVYSIDDVTDLIERRVEEYGKFDLYPNINTIQGFWTGHDTPFSLHSTSGIYYIFKDDILEYIGKSDKAIGTRISRFVKEVNNESLPCENFPAGEKWRRWYGLGNFDGCKIMFADYGLYDIEKYGIKLEAIESRLIKKHQPRMNIDKS
jgi:hypothetical protein